MLGHGILTRPQQLLLFGFRLSVAQIGKLPPEVDAVLFVELSRRSAHLPRPLDLLKPV